MASLPEPAYACDAFKAQLWDMTLDPVAPDWRVKGLSQLEYEAIPGRGEIMPAIYARTHREKASRLLGKYWTSLQRLEAATNGFVTVTGGVPESFVPQDAIQSKLLNDFFAAQDGLAQLPKEAVDAVYAEALDAWEKQVSREASGEASPGYANPFDPFTEENWTGLLEKDLRITGKYPEKDKAYQAGAALAVHDMQNRQPLRIALLDRYASESMVHAVMSPDWLKKNKSYAWDVLDQVSKGYSEAILSDEVKEKHPDYFKYAFTLTGIVSKMVLGGYPSAEAYKLFEAETTKTGIFDLPSEQVETDLDRFFDRIAELRELNATGAAPGSKELAENPLSRKDYEKLHSEAEGERIAAWEAKRKTIHDPVAAVHKIMQQYREQQTWIVSFLRRHMASASQLEVMLGQSAVQDAFGNIHQIACALVPYEQEMVQNWLMAEAEAAGRLAEVAALAQKAEEEKAAEEERYALEDEKMMQEILEQRRLGQMPILTEDNYKDILGTKSAREHADEDYGKLKPNFTLIAIANSQLKLIPKSMSHVEKTMIKRYADAYYNGLVSQLAVGSRTEVEIRHFAQGVYDSVNGTISNIGSPAGIAAYKRGQNYVKRFNEIHMT